MTKTAMEPTAKMPGRESPKRSSLPKCWQARLIVSLIMLGLACVSLVIMSLHKAYWVFTCIMAGIDAILCIGLVWYVRRTKPGKFIGNLWYMLLHWLGLIVVMYLIIVFIHRGTLIFTIMMDGFVGKNKSLLHIEDQLCEFLAHYSDG